MSKALLASKARAYLAHGYADPCSNFAAFQRTVAELEGAGWGDKMTVDVGNYDHSLAIPGQACFEGGLAMFTKILDWAGFWTKRAE